MRIYEDIYKSSYCVFFSWFFLAYTRIYCPEIGELPPICGHEIVWKMSCGSLGFGSALFLDKPRPWLRSKNQVRTLENYFWSTIINHLINGLSPHLSPLKYINISWLSIVSILKKQRTNSYSLPWSSTVGRDETPYKGCEMMMWRQMNKIHDVSRKKRQKPRHVFFLRTLPLFGPPKLVPFSSKRFPLRR